MKQDVIHKKVLKHCGKRRYSWKKMISPNEQIIQDEVIKTS